MLDIAISKKIAGAFAIVVIEAGRMGELVYNEMLYIEQVRIEYQVVDLGLQEAIEARGALTQQENSLRCFTFQDEYDAERVKSLYENYLSNLDRLRQIKAVKPAMLASIEGSASSTAAWQTQIADVVLQLSRAADKMPQAIGLLRSDLSASFMDPSEKALDANIAEGQAASRANANDQEVVFVRAWQIVSIGIAVLVVAASLIGWMLSRGIATPIARRGVNLRRCDLPSALVRRLASCRLAKRRGGDRTRSRAGTLATAIDNFVGTYMAHDKRFSAPAS